MVVLPCDRVIWTVVYRRIFFTLLILSRWFYKSMGFPQHTPYLWTWGGRQGCRLMKISNTPNLSTFVSICPIYLVCWCIHPNICRATLKPGAGDKDPATAQYGFCLLYTSRICTPKYAFTLVDAPTGTPPVEKKITSRRTLQKTPVASELGIVIRLEWKMV